MKYMQMLKDERPGKKLTVEVIDELSSGLESNVGVTFFAIVVCSCRREFK